MGLENSEMSLCNNVIIEQLHDTAMTYFCAHVVMRNNVIVEQLYDTAMTYFRAREYKLQSSVSACLTN